MFKETEAEVNSHLCENTEESKVLKVDSIRRIFELFKEAFIERTVFKQVYLLS